MLLALPAGGGPDPAEWRADDVAAVAPAAVAPTWTEVRPILERSCGGCHYEGGPTPLVVSAGDTFVTGLALLPGVRDIVHHFVAGVVGVRDVPGLLAMTPPIPSRASTAPAGWGTFRR